MSNLLKGFENFVKSKLKNFVFQKRSKKNPQIIQSIQNELLNTKNILILRQDRIGDLLVSVPFVRTLREKFPQKRIGILLSHRNIVAKTCIQKYVDDIFVFPRNLFAKVDTILKIRNIGYELVIDLFDNPSFTSSIIIRAIKPKFSLGFDKENRNVYSFVVPLPNKMENHIVERIFHLLLPFGINPQNVNNELEYPLTKENPLPQKKSKRLGIVLAGSSKSKFWGIDNFAKLIELINSKYSFEIVLFGTSSYKNEISFFSHKQNIQIAPFTKDFDEFVSMVASCDFLITPDTSVVHLASAFKIPVLVFYTFVGEQYGMPWYPINTKFKAIVSKKDSYSDITPEFAFEKFAQLVEI
ncbi:MAG: hypothetical protein CH6_3215 [Candidatus Kapaibacterium sp.]|nr:MAG: hypothetical protein CH6_3215 [Candidatus Kapabacteria bacterium]